MESGRSTGGKGKIGVENGEKICYNVKDIMVSMPRWGMQFGDDSMRDDRRRPPAPAPEENEGQIEGRNALTEALRSGDRKSVV